MNEIGLSKHMDSEENSFPKSLVRVDSKKLFGFTSIILLISNFQLDRIVILPYSFELTSAKILSATSFWNINIIFVTLSLLLRHQLDKILVEIL